MRERLRLPSARMAVKGAAIKPVILESMFIFAANCPFARDDAAFFAELFWNTWGAKARRLETGGNYRPDRAGIAASPFRDGPRSDRVLTDMRR